MSLNEIFIEMWGVSYDEIVQEKGVSENEVYKNHLNREQRREVREFKKQLTQ